jgi:hypothetical protein
MPSLFDLDVAGISFLFFPWQQHGGKFAALLTHRKPAMASDALYHHISLKKGITIFLIVH